MCNNINNNSVSYQFVIWVVISVCNNSANNIVIVIIAGCHNSDNNWNSDVCDRYGLRFAAAVLWILEMGLVRKEKYLIIWGNLLK